MNLLDADKLVLFILFVVPGFISLKFYELLYPSEGVEGAKKLFDALTYSCVNYALLAPLLIPISGYFEWQSNPYVAASLLALTLVIAPIVWVILWRALRLRLSESSSFHHPVDKPWDYLFSQKKKYWVKIYLKSGDVIGGYYGSKSFASSAPQPQEIYLEETWMINSDGGFARAKTDSSGVLVAADVISHIELIQEH